MVKLLRLTIGNLSNEISSYSGLWREGVCSEVHWAIGNIYYVLPVYPLLYEGDKTQHWPSGNLLPENDSKSTCVPQNDLLVCNPGNISQCENLVLSVLVSIITCGLDHCFCQAPAPVNTDDFLRKEVASCRSGRALACSWEVVLNWPSVFTRPHGRGQWVNPRLPPWSFRMH